MNILDDTCIRKRYSRWVCDNCFSPIKLNTQTSKIRGDCEKCKYCNNVRCIRTNHWRFYPDSIDLFFDKIKILNDPIDHVS